MAILLYVGTPGQGKSYDVVANRVLPELKKGRRVVTNIRGLEIEKISAYLSVKDKKFNPENVGELVSINNEKINEANFFPHFNDLEQPVEEGCFLRRDDYLIIDESWRFFPDDKKLSSQISSFFAEHRHFSIDCILINQSKTGIAKYIISRVESVYECKKLNRLGLKKYLVYSYPNTRMYKSERLTSSPHSFKPEIYALYKSYADGKGGETSQSKTIYTSPKALFLFSVFFIALIVLLDGVRKKLFNPSNSESITQSSNIIADANASINPISLEPPLSQRFRVTGVIRHARGMRVIIFDGSRYLPIDGTMCIDSVEIDCIYRGEKVTRFSGTFDEVKK